MTITTLFLLTIICSILSIICANNGDTAAAIVFLCLVTFMVGYILGIHTAQEKYIKQINKVREERKLWQVKFEANRIMKNKKRKNKGNND